LQKIADRTFLPWKFQTLSRTSKYSNCSQVVLYRYSQEIHYT
jgi:hypothetical protein